MKNYTTLALIKPDVTRLGFGSIVQEIEEDYNIVGMKLVKLEERDAAEFYAEHKGKPFLPGLIKQMTSGPVVALALEGPDAIRRWRGWMGPTDPVAAKEKEPYSLRARFGTELPNNGFHGSDSEESAKRELYFFFRKDFT